MTFLWILGGVALLLFVVSLVNWWRDEQEKAGRVITRLAMPLISTSTDTPLHPSIDPYLAELREYLLQDPLPQGPGEMAERVWTHLNEWLNAHLTADTPYTVTDELADELLIEPSRYVDISRNDPVLPSGQVQNITDGFDNE